MKKEIRKVTSWGSSTVVALPKPFLQKAGISVGEYVTVELGPDASVRLKRIMSPEVNPPILKVTS